MKDAHQLMADLQKVLELRIRTGQITLHVRDGRLDMFETKTCARLRPATEKLLAQTGETSVN